MTFNIQINYLHGWIFLQGLVVHRRPPSIYRRIAYYHACPAPAIYHLCELGDQKFPLRGIQHRPGYCLVANHLADDPDIHFDTRRPDDFANNYYNRLDDYRHDRFDRNDDCHLCKIKKQKKQNLAD